MKIYNAVLGFTTTFLFFYLSISYVIWDMSWIFEMDIWNELQRFLLICIFFIACTMGAIGYSMTEED